jgi:hypothetical protein
MAKCEHCGNEYDKTFEVTLQATNGSMPIFCKYTAWLQGGADSTLGLCHSPSAN